jgi:hypothetical protein
MNIYGLVDWARHTFYLNVYRYKVLVLHVRPYPMRSVLLLPSESCDFNPIYDKQESVTENVLDTELDQSVHTTRRKILPSLCVNHQN